MEIRKYMKTLPLVAAMLLIASCSSEEIEIPEAPQVAKTILIPYKATVSSGSQTRATLDGDYYKFQSGDKLFVYDDYNKISGELTLTSGAGTNEAVFEGTLTYTPNLGDGDDPTTPANNLSLRAVLKGVNDNLLPSTVEGYKSSGADYSNAIGASLTDAVKKYSHFTAVSNYEYKNFTSLMQRSTFVSFAITLEDGTAAGENITVTIKNGGSPVCSGSVTTIEEDSKIKAKFTAALDGRNGYIGLDGATVTLGTRDPISFASSNPTLFPNYKYSVTKLYKRYTMTATATVPDIPMMYITGGEKTKTFKIKSFPYNKRLIDLLNEYDESYSVIASLATCERTSGENVSVSDSKPYTFTVTGTGTSVFNVSIYGVSFPVTITVTE